MKTIAITGSSGLVGQSLIKYFRDKGVRVIRIVRAQTEHEDTEDTLVWDLESKLMEIDRLEGVDALIHLAGASIADKRWSEAYKDKIYNSRVQSTQFLADKIKELREPPKVVLCASAVGFYGYEDDGKTYTEHDRAADDFLAGVCKDWEEASQKAAFDSVRVVNMRFGVILSKKGGALRKMLPPFMIGLGGKLGSGKQMMSWIALDEIPSIVDFLMEHDITGPVNVTAPEPVSNNTFTKALGRVIKRPTVFPVPAFGARLLFGEMADVLLLNGLKVVPRKLTDAGYQFRYSHIEKALTAVMKK